MRIGITLGLSLLAGGLARAADPPNEPLPTPLTRLEVKRSLEDLKDRPPRIPLPTMTDAESATYGERGPTYEGRLRYHYLTATGDGRGGMGGTREPDPNMTLDDAFKTELFWIVSRTNNCHY